MIYSREKNFVFIHIPRTGGTSLSRVLEPFQSHKGLDDSRIRWGVDYPHHSALAVRSLLGPEKFDRCYRFAFVRNPWERMLSRYFYLRDRKAGKRAKLNEREYYAANDISFESWLTGGSSDSIHELDLRPMVEFLYDRQGHLLVDFIGRYEHWDRDLATVSGHTSVSFAGMPWLNKVGRDHYRNYYNDVTRDIVARLFAADISEFGYSF